MNSIGTYLKETRETLDLQLHEVENKTDINLSVLSRIENGKRLPTKPQLLQLVQLYNYNLPTTSKAPFYGDFEALL